MTLADNFSLKSWLRSLRYSVEYYDDTCESPPTRSSARVSKTMSIGEKGNRESGDGLYANVWDCSGGSPNRKLKTSLESVENSSAVSNYEENLSIYESARSSCGSPTNTRNYSENNDKISDLDDLQSDNTSAQFSETDPIYENLPIYDEIAKENIYENLPLPKNDQEFEEEIYTTIKYLENVLDAADSTSDEDDYASNLTEDFCERDILGDGSSVNFELDDYCEIRNATDEKITESSSSFGEFLREDQIRSNKNNINQRFAKEHTFYEEPEPISPQEIKNIPVPKRNPIVANPWQRFSFPVKAEKENIARPQSYPIFRKNSPKKDPEPSYNIEDDEHFARVEKNEDDCDNFDDCVSSLTDKDDLNLSFAREHRVSAIFDEKVEELDRFEVAEKSIFGNDLILRLKENAITWMTLLMEEFCGEMDTIMEEKELLKTVHDGTAPNRGVPGPNRFPVDDAPVPLRSNSSRSTRNVQTTDFDSRKNVSAKKFDIRGIIKIACKNPECNWLINQKDEYVIYKNESFYLKSRKEVLLKPNVVIRSVRLLNTKSKEPTEVELKDCANATYILTFGSGKSAKRFMEDDKIQVYANDHRINIKDTLLRFLGKRSSREILEKKGIYKNEPIFGNTLKEIHNKSHVKVPPFIPKIIELIERPENIRSMGLYRTSGNLATIQKIRYGVDNGRLDILDSFDKDPDVLTGSLKLFFRELKEPLMPYVVYDKMADIIKIPPKQLTSRDHAKIRSVIRANLHDANFDTFKVIMRHLVEVVKHKEDNKMDAYNLAICWGPSLIYSSTNVPGAVIESPRDLMSQSQDATRLIDYLIGYYEMYPAEVAGRPEMTKRQESRDSIESADSSTKSFKKSNSNLSLSVDEVMKRAIEYIELNLSVNGIYTRAGTQEKTNKILKKLNKKKSTELDKYKNDVHDICNALMIYLRDYPEPLVDSNTVEMIAKLNNKSNQNYLEVRRDVTSQIEKTARKDSLMYLLRHLAKVFNNQPLHEVSKLNFNWTKVLNHDNRIHPNHETFSKFLTVAVEVFNDDLPGEIAKVFKQHQQNKRDRSSRYDNIDCDLIGDSSLLDQKTEQTKL